MALEWAWVGAVTTSGAEVVCRLDGAGDARLAVSVNSDLSSPSFGSSVTADASDVARLTITGLVADTEYFWGVEHDTVIDTVLTGRFKTFPSGAASFTIAAGSCAGGVSNQEDFSEHPVFDWIRDDEPMVFLHMGDFHYRDLVATLATQADFEAGIEGQLLTTKQGECWRKVPISYTWSNHDFKADADTEARDAYDHYVPRYTLSDSLATYHTFVVGRVRVIMLDTQAYRNAPTTTLGSTQKAWLFDTLENATEPLIIINTERPWIGDGRAGATLDWNEVSAEREEIAEFLEDNDLTRRVLLVSGDMHGVAIDNGDNSQYDSAANTPGPPSFMCAALNAVGADQTGEYSYGAPLFANGQGQYGTIAIADDGTDIVATCTAWRVNAAGTTRVAIYRHSFTVFGSGASATTHTKSIGSGRDYASFGAAITAIKAKSIGDAGDTLVFEVYNDAAYDEAITYDPDPGWYRHVTFKPASGQRHDGTAGTGARIVRTGAGTTFSIRHGNLTIEGLEVDAGDLLSTNQRMFEFVAQSGWLSTALSGGGLVTLNGLVCHGLSGSAGGRNFVLCAVTANLDILNSVFYGFALTVSSANSQTAINISANSAVVNILNVTVDGVTMSGGTGPPRGIVTSNNTNKRAENCVVTRVTTGGSGTPVCFSLGANVVRSHNASDDATADGTGSLTGITPANTFVSLTGGSEDYHLKNGSSLIHAGTDLGTSPAGVAFDLDEYDRDADGGDWDIGADQSVFVAPDWLLYYPVAIFGG